MWFWIGFWGVWAVLLALGCIGECFRSEDEKIAAWELERPAGMSGAYLFCYLLTALAVGAFCHCLSMVI